MWIIARLTHLTSLWLTGSRKTEMADDGDDAEAQDIEIILNQLREGDKFYKVLSKDKCLRRRYHVDVEERRLYYFPTKKISCRGSPVVDLSNAVDVKKGWTTDRFKHCETRARREFHHPENKRQHSGGIETWREEQCFSIIFPALSKTIDLVAENKYKRNCWIRGLQYVILNNKSNKEQSLESYQKAGHYDSFIQRKFMKADANGNGTLSLEEIKLIFLSLSLFIDIPTLREKVQAIKPPGFEVTHDTSINIFEFEQLFHQLMTREDLRDIFNRYCTSLSDSWRADDLKQFLLHEQNQEFTLEECTAIIEQFEPTIRDSSSSATMSFRGFENMMFSPEHMIFDSRHFDICQDMTQPLSHYFIASSHNTYLIANQLTGLSSINAYKKVLEEGCRCIELDCWDGSYFDDNVSPENNEEPIIYHGHTLTSKILLRDVVEVIREYAFVSSKYPVILSIENHCSLSQQEAMADYFTCILGDYLLQEPLPDNEDEWPSPEELAYKIIIKGKKLKPSPSKEKLGTKDTSSVPSTSSVKTATSSYPSSPDTPSSALSPHLHDFLNRMLSSGSTDTEEEEDEEEIQKLLEKYVDIENQLKELGIPNPLDFTDINNLEIDDKLLSGEEQLSVVGPAVHKVKTLVSRLFSKKEKTEKKTLHESLSDITVYCQSRKFRNFDEAIHKCESLFKKSNVNEASHLLTFREIL